MKIKKFGSTESRIYSMVQPIAEKLGLIVWDVRFEKEGALWYLRVLLDHMERPVTIADCEAVTRPLNKLLDDTDPIPQSYTLEVGSAGLERELIRETHFDACEGSRVRVRLIRPAEDGTKELLGTLTGFDREQITVQTAPAAADGAGEGESVSVPLSGVAFVRLADFDEDEVRRADAGE
ncbi:MAG: ribosome maturation factor RimP [Oscillospiraceae bacterium]|nr:ribosome maturation factor RimP [Oscillospiraceae bacterium]